MVPDLQVRHWPVTSTSTLRRSCGGRGGCSRRRWASADTHNDHSRHAPHDQRLPAPTGVPRGAHHAVAAFIENLASFLNGFEVLRCEHPHSACSKTDAVKLHSCARRKHAVRQGPAVTAVLTDFADRTDRQSPWCLQSSRERTNVTAGLEAVRTMLAALSVRRRHSEAAL